MAAGQGFKTFTTGEVLSASDVNGYLMQGVLVFASAAARDAAITSPQEGQFAYLKDTNVTTYYTGSAWANLDTTGMTNPMTTTGDTIYSSSGSTPARLGIGTTGQVLTVSGGVPTWSAPAGGGKVAQVLAYQGTNTVALTTSYQTVDSLTITPSATTSKIYASIIIKLNSKNTAGASDSSVKAALFRGATQVGNASVNQTSFMQITQNDGGPVITIPLVYLDSPATTSATTYNVKALDSWTTRTSYASDCYITLWEITA
jgi:hypothetical protein